MILRAGGFELKPFGRHFPLGAALEAGPIHIETEPVGRGAFTSQLPTTRRGTARLDAT